MICLVLLSACAFGDAKQTVVAEGAAVLSGGPASSVRHAALADALRRAVEKASGVLVEAETSTKNFTLSKDAVHTSAEGFVSDYRILEEGPDGGIYRVKIEATVSPGSPVKPLGYLCRKLKETTNPIFSVSIEDGPASGIISGELALLGLKVSGEENSKPDIRIRGEVTAAPTGEIIAGSGLFSADASAVLSVVDCSNGLAIPSIPVALDQPVTGISQSQANRSAVESASRLWVQRNLPLIITALLGEERFSVPGEVTAEDKANVPSFVPESDNTPSSDMVGKLVMKLRDSVVETREFEPLPVDIAVSRFKLIGVKDSQVADDLLEDLSSALTKTGVFELVERAELGKVLDELRIQNSGLIDSTTAKRLGKLVGARGILVGSISDRKTCLVINARLINTETGRIRVAESVVVEKDPEPIVLRAGTRH